MNSSKSSAAQLNYFQQSPVRGQLEIPDGFAKSGWQYLQCTDTPNELRVLLPPRTAFIYSHLLRAESSELLKDRAASWERIVEIRHLKDRMIRKCQRLARSSSSKERPGVRPMFFTLHAPPDFRLKEMERWFKGQGPEFAHVFSENTSTPFCCSKCGPPPTVARQHSTRSQGPPAQRSGQTQTPAHRPSRRTTESTSRATTNTYVNSTAPSTKHDSRTRPPPTHKQSTRVPAVVREFDYMPTLTRGAEPLDDRRSAVSDAPSQIHVPHAHIQSPDPLPVPLRTRESPLVASPDPLSPDASDTLTSDSEDDSDAPPQYPPNYREDSPRYAPPSGQTLPTIHEKSDGMEEPPRPALPRRRSSLKKCNSTSRLSVASQTKSVAWAMDKDWIDQMSRYMTATSDAEALGRELEQMRTEYNEQIGVMKGLCRKVAQSAERVRLETENLRADEAAVRDQEQRLLEHSDELEKKESLFQDRVLAVLEETKRVVQFCDKKRDAHDS